MTTKNGYQEPKSRQISVWVSRELIDYATQVAEERNIPRNRAIVEMLEEHREAHQPAKRRRR
jgi:hypothetical protein